MLQYASMEQRCWFFRDVLREYGQINVRTLLENISRCLKMFQHVSRRFKMFQDVFRCFKMLQDVCRCFKILQENSKCFKMLQELQLLPKNFSFEPWHFARECIVQPVDRDMILPERFLSVIDERNCIDCLPMPSSESNFWSISWMCILLKLMARLARQELWRSQIQSHGTSVLASTDTHSTSHHLRFWDNIYLWPMKTMRAENTRLAQVTKAESIIFTIARPAQKMIKVLARPHPHK